MSNLNGSDEGDASRHTNHIDNRDDGQQEGSSSYMMEGYTPLNFDMNALVMGGDIDDSDDDETDHTENMFAAGYYQLDNDNKRVNGIKTHVGEFASSYQEETEENDDSDSDGLIPVDFEALAEQALRGLDEEHRVTLERRDQEVHTSTQATTLSDEVDDDNVGVGEYRRVEANKGEIASFEAHFPSTEILADSSTRKAARPRKFPAAKMNTATTPKKLQSKQSKEVNLNAVQEAIKSIRTTAPDFASTLDARSSSSSTAVAYKTAASSSYNSLIHSTRIAIQARRETLNLQDLSSHPIIPAGPLAAFRRNTPKARSATHNLSRSATLSEAIYRLWPLICFRKKLCALTESVWLTGQQQQGKPAQMLSIHIIGSDGVECSSEDSVRNSIGAFVRWLDAALKSDVLSDSFGGGTAPTDGIALSIEFSGPNMPESMIGKTLDLLPQTQPISSSRRLGLKSASCSFCKCEYHESSQTSDNVADLTVAFNAGIW
jgi:hypothetical protein